MRIYHDSGSYFQTRAFQQKRSHGRTARDVSVIQNCVGSVGGVC
jgi:hypothetical protein